MAIVSRPVAEYILENQTQQTIRYNKERMKFVWNKKREYECHTRYEYDSFAAKVAAPIWLLVWIMTAGKMGKGLWKVENLTRERKELDVGRGPPPP